MFSSVLPLAAIARLIVADPAPIPVSSPPPTPPLPTTCLAFAAEVVAAHPEPAVALALARAARARAVEVGALPPPELMLEVEAMPLTQPELLPDGAHFMVGLSQRYLPSGSRERRAQAEELDAQALEADGAAAGRALLAAIAQRCLDWSGSARLRAALVAQRALIGELIGGVRARAASGAQAIADVARAEAEGIRLDLEIDRVEYRAKTQRETLVALAGETPVPTDPPALTVEASPPAVRPELDAAALRIAARQARVRAEQRSAKHPGYTLGGGVGGSVDTGLEVIFTAAIELPWWSDVGEGRVDAARAEVDAERQLRAALERRIAAEIATAARERDAIAHALEHHRAKLLPALERTLALERASLAAGAFDLVRWLGAAEALEAARVEVAAMEHELAVAELAVALVGTLATPAPPTEDDEDGQHGGHQP